METVKIYIKKKFCCFPKTLKLLHGGKQLVQCSLAKDASNSQSKLIKQILAFEFKCIVHFSDDKPDGFHFLSQWK